MGIIMYCSLPKHCKKNLKSLAPIGSAKVTLNHSCRENWCFKALIAASFMMPSPSKALVDDRLAGEGTGKAVGINDPILGWVIIGVFTTVWGLYYAATKELGGQREEVWILFYSMASYNDYHQIYIKDGLGL